jgi:hypothetical protein
LPAPQAYVDWINAHLGFNPRSQANSNALSDFVLDDLRQYCPAIANHLGAGVIAPAKNADVLTRVASRNVDLVLSNKIPAAEVRVAVENKTIMAAHGKARWNRYGDIIAYSNHIHNHNRECIAAAIVVVNCSPAYANPDAFAKDLVRPRFNMPRVVAATVKIFVDIPLRTNPDEPNDQPEAIAVVVVDYDGQKPARLVTSELAPQPANPVHYDHFVARICDLYRRRFGAGR